MYLIVASAVGTIYTIVLIIENTTAYSPATFAVYWIERVIEVVYISIITQMFVHARLTQVHSTSGASKDKSKTATKGQSKLEHSEMPPGEESKQFEESKIGETILKHSSENETQDKKAPNDETEMKEKNENEPQSPEASSNFQSTATLVIEKQEP